MAMTTRTIIQGSLRLAGVTQYSEPPSTEELAIGVENLKNLTDIWSTNPSLVWNKTINTFNVGLGDYFVTLPSRPVQIVGATFELSSVSTVSAVVFQLQQLDELSYYQTPVRHSGLPRAYMWDHNVTIQLVGSSTGVITIISQPMIDDLTLTLDSPLSLIPGMEIALKSNLAILLSEEFGKQPSPILLDMAQSSLANIKAQNHRPALTKCDSGLITGTRGYGIIPRGTSIV
jgi:hypothetical protein